jgi:hypothetical protein
VLLAALTISLLAAGVRETVIPNYRHKIAREASDLDGERANELRPRYDFQTKILLGGIRTVRSGKQITQPTFTLPIGLDQYGRQLTAEAAVYQASRRRPPRRREGPWRCWRCSQWWRRGPTFMWRRPGWRRWWGRGPRRPR